jgi:hypothetical protein
MNNAVIRRLLGRGFTAAYYCVRTAQVLPVVFDFANVSEIPKTSIPALHRYQFNYFNGTYDYYIVQEADNPIRTQQLDYFAKWSVFLKGTPFIPGFKHYEVHWGDVKSVSRMHSYMPAHSWFCTAMQFIKVKGETFFWQGPIFQLFTIYSQDMLVKLLPLRSWYHDLNLPFLEHNVHQTRQHLARHYILLFPTSDLYAFQTHHSSDKYVHRNENVTGIFRSYRVEELNAIANFALHGNASNVSFPHLKLNIDIKHRSAEKYDNRIARCISSERHIMLVKLNFKDTCRAGHSAACSVSIDMDTCKPIQEMRFNELSSCARRNETDLSVSSKRLICNPKEYITLDRKESFAYLHKSF